METLTLTLAFGLIALAAHRIGSWFTTIGLPYITGYLGAGALAGTFALDLIPTDAAQQLRFVDEISLGVIAFIAGSELFVPDLRGRLRTIGAMAGGVTAVGAAILGVSLFVLTGLVEFTADLDTPARVAVAVLGAATLLALSPPSTIAVIKEVGARGPFTATVLSTTIVMDVVVVVAFAAASSFAAALVHSTALNLSFIAVLALDLAIAVTVGILLGKTIGLLLRRRLHPLVTAALILASGFGVYEVAGVIDAWSRGALPFEIYIEPLLLTMVAGFTVTNFTDQREAFDDVLHRVAPAVYVAFFTLTGLSLKLDTMVAVLPAAAALFVVRVVAIAIGTRVGARLAGQNGYLASRSWMALITQAGIALGLAREAGVQFPELGAAFTTLIIAVIVLNEVLGPVFLKRVLTRVGEAAEGDPDRRVAIFGIDRNALHLHDRLVEAGWEAVLADAAPEHVAHAVQRGSTAVAVLESPSRTLAGLDQVPDTVVAMTDVDEVNVAICRAAVEAGVLHTVARATTPSALSELHEMGAVVVDPTVAAAALLLEAVRAPDAAELVLHADDTRDTMSVRVGDRSLHGRSLRDVRLPQDVLVLSVRRGAASMVPDGFTALRLGDELTLVGETGALRQARALLRA